METDVVKKQKRLANLDWIRLLCTLAVIMIHTTSRSLEQGGFDLLRLPWPFTMNVLARFAVPMLFLLSGVVLGYRYQSKTSVHSFYKKHILKIFIPYTLWSFFYYFGVLGNPLQELGTSNFHLNLFLKGELYFHLYFIPALTLLYLGFPFIQRYLYIFLQKKNMVLFTILQLYLLALEYYTDQLHVYPAGVRIFILNLYVFIYGVGIGTYYEKCMDYTRKYSKLIGFFLVASISLILFESYKLYYIHSNASYVVEQWRSSVYIYTFSLFAFLLHAKRIPQKLSRHIRRLADVSFFVYFTHVLFITLFWRVLGSYLFSKTQGQIVESLWFNLMVFTFVCLCSFTTALLLSRIPKWKWVIGLPG